jgi:threonine synthase
VDPHTAVGLCAASRYASAHSSSTPLIILSTAHPAKFSSAVEEALKENTTFDFDRDVLPEEFKGLLEKERRVIEVENAEPELTKKVVAEQVEKLFGKVFGDSEENTASV